MGQEGRRENTRENVQHKYKRPLLLGSREPCMNLHDGLSLAALFIQHLSMVVGL